MGPVSGEGRIGSPQLEKFVPQILVLSGPDAIASFNNGNHDAELLGLMGYCKKVSFENYPEMNAFIEGFLLAQQLEEAIIHEVRDGTRSVAQTL